MTQGEAAVMNLVGSAQMHLTASGLMVLPQLKGAPWPILRVQATTQGSSLEGLHVLAERQKGAGHSHRECNDTQETSEGRGEDTPSKGVEPTLGKAGRG
jgi:hypothetical protein